MSWSERNKKSIEAENAKMRRKLGIDKNGVHNLDDLDPEQEYMFLKHIMKCHDMEEGPRIEIRTLFPVDFEFPEPELMNDQDLENKIDSIIDILKRHDIYLGLVSECPDRLVYQYLLDEVLCETTPVTYPEGMHHVFDGCDGCCEDCFQQPYCETGRERKT